MTDNKKEYIEFCKQEKDIPVFSQPWWLDAASEEKNWDVIIIKNGEKIIATFPYIKYTTKLRFVNISMPILTQKLGPYIVYPQEQRMSSKLSFEREIYNAIINQLPKYDYLDINFDYSISNWLPFYWRGFSQTTRYTYVIENIKNIETVYENFDRSKKKNIKKSKGIVSVNYDLSSYDFYENHKYTLSKQGKKISYTYEVFKRLYDSAYQNSSGRVIYAKDVNGNIHSALFVIWDSHSAYDLISTIDPDFRNSGSATLLIYEIIKYVSQYVDKFDFEGSMIQGVEESFRKFGSLQKPYINIYHNRTRKRRIIKSFKDLFYAFIN